MAVHSVPTCADSSARPAESTHDLWIGRAEVLTICLDTAGLHSPPKLRHCVDLNEMIQGLARAAKAVAFQAANDTSSDADFFLQPIENIADAITLLSQLAVAVQCEAGGRD